MITAVLKEAFFVGVLVVIFGTLVGYGVGRVFSSKLPEVCREWNKNHVMEISLFLTGVLVHLVCEYSGLNKWYCAEGAACAR